MPDSFTLNLNMTKPENGGSADTWGLKQNADLDIIDMIFNGDGTGTSIGINVGSGHNLNVAGNATITIAGTAFISDTAEFQNQADPTKILQINCGNIATSSTVILTAPPVSGVIATMLTGEVKIGMWGTVAPSGTVFCNNTSIGSSSSSATQRANNDTQALFTVLWASKVPMVGGRGVSASADWTANKAICTPDHRGRVIAILDTNGGVSSAGVLSPSGIDSANLCVIGGSWDNATTVSVSVSVGVSGSVGGSCSGTLTGGTVDSFGEVAAAASGNGAAPQSHFHDVSVSGTLGGSMSGSMSGGGAGTGSSAAFSIIQPIVTHASVICL